ncbi:SDR family NAD(P)-dependent oxidoreductase [Flammeovirga aprica]|uniref:SDR family NAD(P)-dependent oxidoreductase n=1 Tax=Flammeovirga aprica JL-4 TaxID=694437 RepID=A0A7X9NZJ9_9BACT|nr:SDR family NAD(P)-dependent oxidoreductase [Flammeovirga aprica]NME66819.1 SDR family NAD(P)-dependent oxidoreductase [Flammeovirga aprica JL-4]
MSTVFITGTSKGLGKGFATYFLQEGNQVLGFSRTEDTELTAHPNFKQNNIDLEDFDAIEQVVEKALEGITELDLVILNAGVLGEIKSMVDADISNMKNVMDVNLWSNKVVLDTLFKKGIKVKQVVGISSGASINGNKGWSGYSISKAAFNMMIKLYAAEHQETHFTALAPGLIDTGMQDYLCEKVNHEEFPSMQRLQDARGTQAMPNGKEAGKMIAKLIPSLLNTPNGSYQDVRKL